MIPLLRPAIEAKESALNKRLVPRLAVQDASGSPPPEPHGLRLAISLIPSNGEGKFQALFLEAYDESADFRPCRRETSGSPLKIQAIEKLNFLETSNAQSARVDETLGRTRSIGR